MIIKSIHIDETVLKNMGSLIRLSEEKFKKSLELLEDTLVSPRKFYIRRNNNKVDSKETGRIVIAHLLP